MTIYKYQVVDAGYKLGMDKNVLFATNKKWEAEKAAKAAKESGEGMIVLEFDERGNEQMVYVSAYKTDFGISG